MSLASTTSRTDAHKIFAVLYNKRRPPELQKKVDEALTKSNDIFIRIDLIKRIDQEYEEQLEKERQPNSYGNKPYTNSNTDKKTVYHENQMDAYTRSLPVKRANTLPAKRSSRNFIVAIVDFVVKFFQEALGVDERVIQFAKETEAIEAGIFKNPPELSKQSEKIFTDLNDDFVTITLQALKYCEQNAWKEWEAYLYNSVLNLYEFILSFIELKKVVIQKPAPELLLSQSKKMQMHYIRFIESPDIKEEILKSVPEAVKGDPRFSNNMKAINHTLYYIFNLETKATKFTDVIRAIFICAKNRIYFWPEIVQIYRLPPVNSEKFEAPDNVREQMKQMLDKYEKDLKDKIDILIEREEIRKSYFTFNDSNKVTFPFLGELLNELLKSYYLANEKNAKEIEWKYKNYPHMLVHILCKDLQNIYFPIIDDYMTVDFGHVESVQIANKYLFFYDLQKFKNYLNAIEDFNRRYTNFRFTFQEFKLDYMDKSEDDVEKMVFRLLTDISDLMGQLAKNLHSIIRNHKMAVDYDKQGKLSEQVKKNANRPLDEFKPTARYIPFHESIVVSGNRLNGKKIYDVIFELAKLLFNYSVIFKNGKIIADISDNEKLKASIQELKKTCKRLSGKEYNFTI